MGNPFENETINGSRVYETSRMRGTMKATPSFPRASEENDGVRVNFLKRSFVYRAAKIPLKRLSDYDA